MFVVDQLEIFEGNLTLFWSFSLLCPFMTLFRSASQINYFCFANLNHRLEAGVKWFENLVFTLVHIPKVPHQLWKNVFVSKNTPLWDFDFLRESLDSFMQLLDASEDGIDLESKSPPSWLGIVLFKHINVLSVEILPLRDRFFYPFSLRDSLPKDF